MKNADSLD